MSILSRLANPLRKYFEITPGAHYQVVVRYPIYDNRDAIVGTRSTLDEEGGAFGTPEGAYHRLYRLSESSGGELDGYVINLDTGRRIRVEYPREERLAEDDDGIPF